MNKTVYGTGIPGAKSGFTLVELLVSVSVVAVACVCILGAVLSTMYLNRLSSEYSLAKNACVREAEIISQDIFFNVVADYNNTTFAVTGLPSAVGVAYVSNANPDLLQVWISVCWRQLGSRVIGEDQNLNGIPEASEDTNNNGRIDSPVQLTFLMSAR